MREQASLSGRWASPGIGGPEDEARHFFLQAADRLAQVVLRLVELLQRERGLAGAFVEPDHRLADLVGPLRLGAHPFIDLVEARGQGLDRSDDLAELLADVADLA